MKTFLFRSKKKKIERWTGNTRIGLSSSRDRPEVSEKSSRSGFCGPVQKSVFPMSTQNSDRKRWPSWHRNSDGIGSALSRVTSPLKMIGKGEKTCFSVKCKENTFSNNLDLCFLKVFQNYYSQMLSGFGLIMYVMFYWLANTHNKWEPLILTSVLMNNFSKSFVPFNISFVVNFSTFPTFKCLYSWWILFFCIL